jgi:cobalt transporter subunit CbtB
MQTVTNSTLSSAKASSNAHAKTTTSAMSIVSALLMGGVIIFAVGFAEMSFAHNAAHDTRHTIAFPCH